MEEAVSKRADWRELAAACFIDTDTDAGHWRGEGADRAGEMSVMSTILKAAGSAYLTSTPPASRRRATLGSRLLLVSLDSTPARSSAPAPVHLANVVKRCSSGEVGGTWRAVSHECGLCSPPPPALPASGTLLIDDTCDREFGRIEWCAFVHSKNTNIDIVTPSAPPSLSSPQVSAGSWVWRA